MNEIIYRLRLDCSKPGTQASVYVKKGDIKSRKLSISLYNGSTPYDVPDGCSVVLRAKKPDATIVYDDCTLSGNVVTHLLTSKAVEVSGTVRCELTIYGPDNEVLFSPWFNLYVTDPLYDDDDVISSSEFSALTAAMSTMTALANKWSNPGAKAESGDTAGAKVVITDDGVEFIFTLVKGDKGDTGEKGETGATGATGAPGKDGKNGENGKDGIGVVSVEQTTTSPSDGGTNIVTVTLSDGSKGTFSVKNGSKGSKGDTGKTGDKGETGSTGATGAKGADGVSVTSVEQTTTSAADGGENIVTVTLSNGNTSTFKVKNGSKGSKGDTGKTGAVFTPSVSSAGVLSWSNNGELSNPASVDLVAAVIAALPSADSQAY